MTNKEKFEEVFDQDFDLVWGLPDEYIKTWLHTEYKQKAKVYETAHHPSHYNQGGIECIEAIRACLPPEEFQGFCRGNVLKYAWRYKQKGGVEDLNKAQTYLFWLKESYAEQKENEAYIEHYKNKDGAADG